MRLEVGFPGRVEYGRALAWQEALVARRLAGGPDVLLLLEHPPVYTLGRGADARFLGAAAASEVPVFRAHRGGQVTYHGPGQLVGYPIVDLRAFRPDLRWYLDMLEGILIDALDALGVAAGPGLRGEETGGAGVGLPPGLQGGALPEHRRGRGAGDAPFHAARRPLHGDLGFLPRAAGRSLRGGPRRAAPCGVGGGPPGA